MDTSKKLQTLFKEFESEKELITRLSPKTMEGYRAVFTLFSDIMPEIFEVSALSPDVMVSFFRRLQHRPRLVGRKIVVTGVKDSTIHTYRSKLFTFFEWLHNRGYLQQNPLHQIKPPKVAYDDNRALSETAIRRLYTGVSLCSPNSFVMRRDTLILSIFLYCGLRLGEFLGLQATDVDLEKGLIVVNAATSKSRRVRILPIHPTLKMHLSDYLKERGLRWCKTEKLIVSATTDRGISRDGLIHWVDRLREKSGVRFHLHQFRHTFAYNLASENVNAAKIQKLLGHSSLNMTMKYLRAVQTENLLEDITKLKY